MKKFARIVLALASLCSLRACATADLFSGKEVTVSMGDDGKPQIGVRILGTK